MYTASSDLFFDGRGRFGRLHVPHLYLLHGGRVGELLLQVVEQGCHRVDCQHVHRVDDEVVSQTDETGNEERFRVHAKKRTSTESRFTR